MKFKILPLIVLFFSNLSFGQIKSGEIIYTIKSELSLSKMMEKSDKINNEMKKMLESFESTEEDDILLKLHFNEKEALFFFEDEMESETSGINLALIFAKNMGKIYIDIKNGKIISQKELGGTFFLVQKDIKDYKWKLINESKQIGQYNCYKATTSLKSLKKGKETETVIEAWYAPSLPINIGPLGYAGLPGLIIELKDGKMGTYSLKEINFDVDKNRAIEKLTKGKVVTSEEYKKISKSYHEKKMRRSKRNK